MRAIDAVQVIADTVTADVAVFSGLGRSSYCVDAVWPNRSLCLDSLGDTLGVATGFALGLGQIKWVHTIAVIGDGSMLFSLESLHTLSQVTLERGRLTVVMLDNGLYESSGGLPVPAESLDWQALIEAFGISYADAASTEGLRAAICREAAKVEFIRVVTGDDDKLPPPSSSMNGSESTFSFRTYVQDCFGVFPDSPAVKY